MVMSPHDDVQFMELLPDEKPTVKADWDLTFSSRFGPHLCQYCHFRDSIAAICVDNHVTMTE